MSVNQDRQRSAKKIIQGKGRDVAEQRADRRQRLVQKFKSLRIQTVDNMRNLKDSDLTYELLCQLRKQLLVNLDGGSLVQEDEVDEFVKDIEEELQLIQSENFERTEAEEIEAITNNLMNMCDICDNLIVDNGICDLCMKRHFCSQI